MKDFFDKKANDYEKNEKRIENVNNIANAVINTVSLRQGMDILDFGAGTGLLLERIAPHVGKIVAVDISKSMIKQLEAKLEQIECEVDILEINLELEVVDRLFDGIISSMTMHHIKEIERVFQHFYQMLRPGGFVAIADLESEDGSFHTEDTGVHHHGFQQDEFIGLACQAGFNQVEMTTVSLVHKPHGKYPVFLMTAVK